MKNSDNTFFLPITPPAQAEGEIVAVQQDGEFIVQVNGCCWRVLRAASCLLQPERGDRVLLHSVNQQLWLLAVLVRAKPQQPAVLHCESDLHLSTRGSISLHSQKFQVRAQQGECDIDEMQYRGTKLSAWVSVSRLFGKQCESVWQSISQFSQRLLRHTEQCEQVRAGQLDVKTEDFTRLHSRNTLISSKSLTKVDAKQIHMG